VGGHGDGDGDGVIVRNTRGMRTFGYFVSKCFGTLFWYSENRQQIDPKQKNAQLSISWMKQQAVATLIPTQWKRKLVTI